MDVALARWGKECKRMSGVEKKGEWRPCTAALTGWLSPTAAMSGWAPTLRGGTMQFLHVSELAHVSVHAPWRAREIRSGAINTVPLAALS